MCYELLVLIFYSHPKEEAALPETLSEIDELCLPGILRWRASISARTSPTSSSRSFCGSAGRPRTGSLLAILSVLALRLRCGPCGVPARELRVLIRYAFAGEAKNAVARAVPMAP